MREMKDSGIEWIGEIPKDWEVCPLKYVCSYNEKTLPENTNNYFEFDYIDIGSVTYGKGITNYQHLTFSNAPSRARRIVKKDDVILSTVRTYLKATAQIPDNKFPIIVSTGYLTLRANHKINPQFLKYSIQQEAFVSEIEAKSSGVSYPAINASEAVQTNIILSPVTIQRYISSYLDVKCSEIDAIATDIQKEITVLEDYKKSVITEAVTKGLNPNVEMKDSGIEWIGEIPREWKVDKIKYHLKRNEPKNPGNAVVLSVYRDYGVIPKDSRNDNHNVTSEDISKYKYVKKGQLVINKMKAWQGSLAVSDYEGIVSPAYFIYDFVDGEYNHKYFHYLVRSCYKEEFKRISGGIREGQWDLSPEGFSNTLVLLPSIKEQNNILNYILQKENEIDSLIVDKKKQLELLAEYKKSLIYEYVTGKKEVPLHE